MNIQFVLFIIVLVSGFLFSSLGNTEKNRRNYIIFMMIVLILESCLRGLSVGSDTSGYFWMFQVDGNMSWLEVWQQFINRYVKSETEFDVGFVLFNKIIYSIIPNFSIYLGICALFFFIPFGQLLNRYIKDFTQLIFVFVLYVALFNMIAMSGVRKEIALGCTVWATLAWIDKKYISMILSLIVGTLIHMTTLLWLLVPILSFFHMRKLRVLHICALFLVPVVIAFSGIIIVFMGNVIGMEKYADYGRGEVAGGAMTFTLLIEVISLFCLIAYRRKEFNKGLYMQILYTTLPCFTFLAPLITNNGSMIRISQYFHLYILVLFPMAIDCFFINTRSMIYLICSAVLVYLTIASGYEPYYFIWEDFTPRY